jgi:hypothetical protein
MAEIMAESTTGFSEADASLLPDDKIEAPIRERSEEKPPQYFYLITYPRSASNLLVQILNLHEQKHVVTGGHGGYYFMPPVALGSELQCRGKKISDWTVEQIEQMKASYKKCGNKLVMDQLKVQSGESEGNKNKTMMFVKEHSEFIADPMAETKFLYGENGTDVKIWPAESVIDGQFKSKDNCTILSDKFLLAWMPTFLIRHPAQAFPSCYRALLDVESSKSFQGTEDPKVRLLMTLHWSRRLFDFYSQNMAKSEFSDADRSEQFGGVNWPIVLDADDVMTDQQVVRRFASIVGLDVTKLKFKWEPVSQETIEKQAKGVQRYLSTIQASTGIVKSKISAGIDINVEAQKWREEFGEQHGRKMEQWVRDAMPDYEYLKAKRLRPEASVVDGHRV